MSYAELLGGIAVVLFMHLNRAFLYELICDNRTKKPSSTKFMALGAFFVACAVVLFQLFKCTLDAAVFFSFIATFATASAISKGISAAPSVVANFKGGGADVTDGSLDDDPPAAKAPKGKK